MKNKENFFTKNLNPVEVNKMLKDKIKKLNAEKH